MDDDLSMYERRGTLFIGYRRDPCAELIAEGRGGRQIQRAGRLFRRICAEIRAWGKDEMEQNETRESWSTKTIRNRDIPKLTRVLYAMQDVSVTERRRLWLQDRLWNMTARLTGMPGGGGDPKGYDANFADICEAEERYTQEVAEYLQELKEAEDILNGIGKRELRTFAAMKYVMGMKRRIIMRELNLRRWEYEKISEMIEQAESMKGVQWPEKYALKSE